MSWHANASLPAILCRYARVYDLQVEQGQSRSMGSKSHLNFLFLRVSCPPLGTRAFPNRCVSCGESILKTWKGEKISRDKKEKWLVWVCIFRVDKNMTMIWVFVFVFFFCCCCCCCLFVCICFLFFYYYFFLKFQTHRCSRGENAVKHVHAQSNAHNHVNSITVCCSKCVSDEHMSTSSNGFRS